MNNKKSIAIEIMWLTLAIISTILGIYKTIIIDLNNGIPFFVISLVSIIMYTLRRYVRKYSSKTK